MSYMGACRLAPCSNRLKASDLVVRVGGGAGAKGGKCGRRTQRRSKANRYRRPERLLCGGTLRGIVVRALYMGQAR